MATAIKVENLSKIYRLGEIGTGTISRDLERFVKTKILKQEDPFLKIGEANDRAIKGDSDIVYSLKDINFEIEQGDAVGIIGRNGAGKSTLLKILSRVTSPTTGKINIKGRVASLLEVGTGFHPELTGRENIYLNGAILGMQKREIDRKLNEVIDFSGVERYIDTPVKRYSSGMYVRLAFAVAAHLESEILIVDEVLAVGDAEFQKKCLGKMGEISKGEGRTVLFVSHNLAAVNVLTNVGIFLNNGTLGYMGDPAKSINLYTSYFRCKSGLDFEGKGKYSRIIKFNLIDEKNNETNTYKNGDILKFKSIIETDGTPNLSFELFLYDSVSQQKIGMFSMYQFSGKTIEPQKGVKEFIIEIKPLNLASGVYRIEARTSIANVTWDHVIESACIFEVLHSNFNNSTYDYKASFDYGNIALLPNKL